MFFCISILYKIGIIFYKIKYLQNVSLTELEQAKHNLTNNLPINDINLLKLITKIENTNALVQGSSSSLKFRRNEIRSYIINFGIPLFFVTISPADIHSALFIKLCGIENVEEYIKKSNSFDRLMLVNQNPYIQAKYFDIIINAFLSCLLNYEKNKIGILGTVTAYYGIIEAQGRGSLHIHMFIWMDNHIFGDLNLKLKLNNEYKRHFFKYLDYVINSDTSLFKKYLIEQKIEEDIHICCKPIEYIYNDPIKIYDDALRLVKKPKYINVMF